MTGFQNKRLADQTTMALADLRRSMRNNSRSYKEMAADPSRLAEVQAIIANERAAYAACIALVDAQLNDPALSADYLDGLRRANMTAGEVRADLHQLRFAALQFAAADISTPEAIAAACDALFAAVPEGKSLWRE